MRYDRRAHAAWTTDDYVFQQLIPYIGNKRKLLWLIAEALALAERHARPSTFLDLFTGSTVVARFAKRRGYRVVANDWEPYSACLARAAIECGRPPALASLGGYERAIATLNELDPVEGWVTRHLCPADDARVDPGSERLFFQRKNGLRIDAVRTRIERWRSEGHVGELEAACLIAPLLYQVCYTSNTSGVFKGFHDGWGGRNGTALHRIGADLKLRPLAFLEHGREHRVFRRDATELAMELAAGRVADLGDAEDVVAYLDPPYNQHPYASNYHVLNTVTLWDAPPLAPRITGRDKAAIRPDWVERRSAYNHRASAAAAFERLLDALRARTVLVSYSTDGMIPLETLVELCALRGRVEAVTAPYKRYRVSPTRPSRKPLNVELVLVLDRSRPAPGPLAARVEELVERIRGTEHRALAAHPES